jgi:hypothetical protein
MRRQTMMNNIIFITTVLLFGGCFSSLEVELEKDDVLENRYVSFSPPSVQWYLLGDREWSKSNKIPNQAQWMRLFSSPKGASYDLEISTDPYRWWKLDILFDKDGDYEARSDYLQNTPETLARNKEQRISYSKDETQYLNGLKCIGSVFSRSSGGSAYSLNSKNYSITCGYYDKTVTEDEGKRILRIGYTYRYAGGSSRLQKDEDVTKDEMPSVSSIEKNLKDDIKALISTLHIKNLDKERMEKEGLMHYDQEYKSTKW